MLPISINNEHFYPATPSLQFEQISPAIAYSVTTLLRMSIFCLRIFHNFTMEWISIDMIACPYKLEIQITLVVFI